MAILFKLINVQSHNSQPFQRLIDAQPFEGTTFKEEVGLVDPFKWARMGSAIYPTLALVNHSCDSNCIRVFIDKKAALITTRVVTAGEELTESYREARAKGFVRVSELCSEHLLIDLLSWFRILSLIHICTVGCITAIRPFLRGSLVVREHFQFVFESNSLLLSHTSSTFVDQAIFPSSIEVRLNRKSRLAEHVPLPLRVPRVRRGLVRVRGDVRRASSRAQLRL